ncbi:MAG: lytic transglycosylase [Alphaproteobacteria bacterium BRH_c36]|nr:MAG: lytic transglycosylase [Alphaproteobacteria bacterium BRH_c36]
MSTGAARKRSEPWAGGFAVMMLVVAITLAISTGQRLHAEQSQSFAEFIESLWPEARDKFQVSHTTFDRATKGLKPDLSLPDLALKGKPRTVRQAEFTRAPSEYLDSAYLGRLAQTGRGLAAKFKSELAEIETRFGVESAIVLAIFGRETAFGAYTPEHDAIRVLATQAWTGRRKERFRGEFLYALKLLEMGVPREKMRASWAGAMGLTQFLPSEFFTHVHDFGGDGYADLFDSVPDALASAARQLKNHGWVRDLEWGYELVIPQSADCAMEGPAGSMTFAQWIEKGFKRVGGKPWPAGLDNVQAYLMSPAGGHGPSFLVTDNFKAIREYNTSDLYATFIGNLADRIRGGGDFQTPWKAIGPQKTAVIRAVQEGLKARGHPIAVIDGFIGSNTRREAGQFQRANGMKVDCWPSEDLVRKLNAG